MKVSQALTKNKNKLKKRFAFTCDEDDKLRGLVNKFGENNWTVIAGKMKKRSPRQCKDRWVNYLSPVVVNGTWTPDEERLLYEKVEMYGRKWKYLTNFFFGRTDINIKNHYNFLQKKKEKEILKEKYKNNFSNERHAQSDNHIKSAAEIIVNSNGIFNMQTDQKMQIDTKESIGNKSPTSNNSENEKPETNFENQLIEDFINELTTDEPGANEFMIGFYDYLYF